MRVISRGVSLAILLAGVTACTGQAVDREAFDVQPLSTIKEMPEAIASCGASPSSITYWATERQRDVLEEDGVVGGCEFDQACLPTCWGSTTQWTTWSRPLIQCPCPAL